MKEWFTGCPVNTMIQRRLRCVGWLLTWTVLGIVLSSCAPTFQKDITRGQRLGFRPDEPDFPVPTAATVWADFKQYAIYSKQLKEAYRTRTTQKTARTNSAEGALIRAAAGQKALAEVVNAQLDANPTRVTLTAAITQIDGKDKAVVDVLGEGKLVTLTVVNAQ